MKAVRKLKESTIEEHFCSGMALAFPDAQILKYEARRGEPDRICLLPGGKAVFVELKRPGKKPRPEQERALARLRNLGFGAYWVDTKDAADKLIGQLTSN